MAKSALTTVHEKRSAADRILDCFEANDSFLVAGHSNPDEDCAASICAVSLLLTKMSKRVTAVIIDSVHDNLDYLLRICRYNAISIVSSIDPAIDRFDAIVVCDTPKPSMISMDAASRALLDSRTIPVIEIDHHIGADSEYIGDPDLRLVTDAVSASELAGYLAFKLSKRTALVDTLPDKNILSRNLILAVLTGIVGDSKMGKYLKTGKERRYYEIYAALYNRILGEETTKSSNFFEISQIFSEIQRLSRGEEGALNYIISRRKSAPGIGYTYLSSDDVAYLEKNFGRDTMVTAIRAAADFLAEESGKLSLVVYDESDSGGLVQFRMRRAQSYRATDIRDFLQLLKFENGGGHEGAIGFRAPAAELGDLESFIENAVKVVTRVINPILSNPA
jgi:nanoRNase/pAp phosphatase (c-di-AMP/oligoRNAs hydrolase)